MFAENLALSPGEIRDALDRGVVVFGASSMGALRAAEIPRITGIGRIFEMYRDGVIERDDEVALIFDPETSRPLTEPLVNVRYAVDRLVRSATLTRETGKLIVDTCAALHYTERTYAAVMQRAPLARNQDTADLIRLLRTFDLKRDDAQLLLETLAQLTEGPALTPAVMPPSTPGAPSEVRVQPTEDSHARILIWESGDSIELVDLIRFLKLTGTFEAHARNALARFALGGTPLRAFSAGSVPTRDGDRVEAAQALLDATRLVWGWESPEEAHVTMRDLGLGLQDVSSSLEAEVATAQLVARFAAHSSRVFAKALRAELWMHDLALKREVMRCGALKYLAGRSAETTSVDERELDDARRTICRLRMAVQWSAARSELAALGISEAELDESVRELALARRAARPIIEALDRRCVPRPPTPRATRWCALGLAFERSPKPEGTRRFSRSLDEAAVVAGRIARQMGVVRIGMIGELDTLGVHVAQAFGERSGWSSTFSSGKAETREGARVGSIMEEVEIHAQDAFQPASAVWTSFADAPRALAVIDPVTLELPFDSRYRDTLELAWAPCVDLLGGCHVHVPSACLVSDRVTNDIYYSPRLGGKIFSSSGLGSGFSLAEATVHAAAEVIERHAVRLAELELDNPGRVGVRQFWFVDLASLPETPRRIVERYRKAGMCVRILDITSEIAVPTFYARVFDDPFDAFASTSSDGFACHPDPEVAVTMALLEAAQTKAGVIAGGREDYSLQARSLGRHERPRTMVSRSQVFWFCNDRPVRPLEDTVGFIARDILEELEWIVDRVHDAGFAQFLVADYTMVRIRPAYAVRVVVPGIETTNPLYTGPRARATLVRDLLPRAGASP